MIELIDEGKASTLRLLYSKQCKQAREKRASDARKALIPAGIIV